MSREFDYVLCDTEFWNTTSIWNTDRLQFSKCFRDTALIWLPGLLFLLSLLSEVRSLRCAKRGRLIEIPWNTFNRTRLLVVLLLIALKLTEASRHIYQALWSRRQTSSSTRLLDYIVESNGAFGAPSATRLLVLSSLLGPLIQILTYGTLATLYVLQRRVGRHTSALIWAYLLVAVLCGTVEFYEQIASIRSNNIDLIELVAKYNHFPLLVVLFLFDCYGDKPVLKVDNSDPRIQSPELKAGFASHITMSWFNGFLVFGYKNKLDLKDLWQTLARDRTDRLAPLLTFNWLRGKRLNHSEAHCNSKKGMNSYELSTGEMQQFNGIVRVLFRIYWRQLALGGLLKFLQDSFNYAAPIFLKLLLAFMSSNEPVWHGVIFAISLFLFKSVQSVLLGNMWFGFTKVGLQARSMLIGSIYRKALQLSGSSRLNSTRGEMVNLMAVDSQRFQDSIVVINLIWSAPYQIMLAITFLYMELGWPVFVGVACMFLALPLNFIMTNWMDSSQVKLMNKKDERMKQMNEILSGIKVIKLYSWESSFMKLINNIRNHELHYLRKFLNISAFLEFMWQCTPLIVTLVTFGVYVSIDDANVLNAEKIFVSLTLFNMMRAPLGQLPWVMNLMVLTRVSARRISKFLNSDEIVTYVTRNEELEAIAIEGGTLSWSSASTSAKTDDESDKDNNSVAVLKDIDLHVAPGKFVAVIGRVASGKSSLLASILGELHRISGRFNVCKSMKLAYVPQQAWIQNMTVRDNILFGSTYNEQRYQQVLSVCCLEPDLETLPGGDQAEIGEKGINLSGGQKQRVSLARACYSCSDIYLLDDPLSALDSHVAKHVFNKVLSSSSGLLRGKTRIIATNSLFVLPYVDQVVVLEDGRIVESGSYKELMSIEGGHLSETMRQYSSSQEEAQTEEAKDQRTKAAGIDAVVIDGGEQVLGETLKGEAEKKQSGKLMDIELMETGKVSLSVYLCYLKAASIKLVLFVLTASMAATVFDVATNLWLSRWSSDAESPDKSKDTSLRSVRLGVYAGLNALQCFFILIGSLCLSLGSIKAARRLHSSLLDSIMHSPMNFFDTTPMGRVVNRFSKDINVCDSDIPKTLISCLECLLQVLSTYTVVCWSFPIFVALLIPMTILYVLILCVFIVTTRQLKRLESISRSPIYSFFSETLSGINSIRAYNCVDRFVRCSDNLIDNLHSCSYPNFVANRWLAMRLEFFGNLITFLIALVSVYYRGFIGAGIAGLTISYSMNITLILNWLVRMLSDLETNIVSVERILEYTRGIQQEDLWIKENNRPEVGWPSEGAITIDNYSTRYRQETDLVLKDLNIVIKPREKVGIVGRTGSGKTSLSLSLFRVLEPASGRILIDGQDVSKLGLHDLRSKLTIIPQDPVLFSGTIRFNLDPLQQYTDFDIWRSLELAHLKGYIGSLEGGLDNKVSEYGENFSLGQRQLICLARAILRNSKVLILDEATASVDLETDSIVQRTIRDVFSHCTIITIAHRLHTILDSDRILVLDNGSVLEFESPSKLISNVQSSFSSLIRDSGIDRDSLLANDAMKVHLKSPDSAPDDD